jgi:poly-gamma-glutamate synthesis protein (capsule biosynthesis protein)
MVSCNQQEKNLKIAFTGDVILDRGVNDELKLHGDSLLTNSFAFLQKQDFLVINLEGTLTDSGIIQADRYNFKANADKAKTLKQAGITHVAIANNHIFDYGKTGYDNTINAIETVDLKPLGNIEKPTIIQKGKYQCAVLSASLTTYNDSLPISSIDELKASVLNFSKKQGNIPLILYIHWGLELQPTPETWQKVLANELINMGVDAIIGHHPHVTQSIEFINDKPVFYSIGNYIADAYLPDTDRSYVVEFDIKNTIENVSIVPIRLSKYFAEPLPFKDQIFDLKKHIKYSNISLSHQNKKWFLEQTSNVNFSEKTDLWMISAENTISKIKKLNPSSYLLSFQKDGFTANVINLHGNLTEFEISDINNDNNIDVLIGITKKVKFDPTDKKRINIYTFKNQALEPLWLGTKFINEVESFSIVTHNSLNFLMTTEKVNSSENLERIYEWDDFGFALTDLNKISK